MLTPDLIILSTKLSFLGRLNAAEQREFQGRMEKKQMKDFMNVGLQTQPFLSHSVYHL